MTGSKSNRRALRALSERYPAPPEIEAIISSLRTESDMSVAITGVAILEGALERLLIVKFRSRSMELNNQLFKNRGPLSDFHSKILIASAFGVITSAQRGELQALKAIRNAFAHASVPITFEDPSVAKETQALKMLRAIKAAETEAHQRLELSNKAWFLLIAQILLISFDAIRAHTGTASEALVAAAERLEAPPDKKL